jgi:two-component system chemotaxis sensor kinase CheA
MTGLLFLPVQVCLHSADKPAGCLEGFAAALRRRNSRVARARRAKEYAMDELTREFLIESQEGLDRMERCLTDLEQSPDDAALIAEIFRSVHTIKGTTGFLGYKRLEKLAHAGENLLGLLRDGKLTANAPIVTVLLHLLDGLRLILRNIEAEDHEGPGDDADLIDQLEGLQFSDTTPQPAFATVVPAGAPPPKRPRRKRARQTAPPESFESRILDSTTSAPSPKTVKAEALIAREDVNAGPRISSSSTAESTLRVDIALLNRMMNLVGELVLTRNQILQATATYPGFTLLSRRLDMVTADLREAVMKARMQPVSNVFSKIPRMVRDLSQALKRRVRLEMEGQETELDKSLLEAIKDPLTHAVRNAIDHGIEAPEVRLAAGKDPEGTLKLRAMQEGSHVIIEVSDDGAGIGVDKVRTKAIERGIITAERAAQSSERELLQLIFMPGFSTASAITNVSGRGVGMDVVRTNVEKIGGKVELDSRSGKGTTLRLRIPLTLAIVPALIVRNAGQSFALPQSALSELVHVRRDLADAMIEWIDDAPLYRLRGRLLPLVILDDLVGGNKACRRLAERDIFIAVLDADGRVFGLVIDGLADPEEIVVKSLNASLKGIGLYSGATVLGNGDLALILDSGAIAQKAGIKLTGGAEDGALTGSTGAIAGSGDKAVEYLLVDAGGRRAAIPLEKVLRIEQLPISRIEYAGFRPVLGFEGQILPVEDAGHILTTAAIGDPSARVVIVVCREGNRQVGIVVSHVLDVAPGSDLLEAGTCQHAAGATLLKDRVTDIVDLRGMSSLPASSVNLSQSAEAIQ